MSGLLWANKALVFLYSFFFLRTDTCGAEKLSFKVTFSWLLSNANFNSVTPWLCHLLLFSFVHLLSSFKFSIILLYISITSSICVHERQRETETQGDREYVHATNVCVEIRGQLVGLGSLFLCLGPGVQTQVLSPRSKALKFLALFMCSYWFFSL